MTRTRDIRAETENGLGKRGQDDLSECSRAVWFIGVYRKEGALCVLTPSAVLLILAVLAVPEPITDQRVTLPEAAGVTGRLGSHCCERQKSHERRTPAVLSDEQQCPSKVVT